MFKYEETGKIVHIIETGENNPRNSEGAFVNLGNGDILFAYTKYTGKKSYDNSKACIASIVSQDEGETWVDSKIIVTPEEHKATNVMSVSLIRDRFGRLIIFYLVRKGWNDLRMVKCISHDEGKTWGKPEYCMKHKGYYEVHNDRVIVLSNGRIIIPSSFYRYVGMYNPYLFKGIGVFFISDDFGKTWVESLQSCTMPVTRSTSGLQEPGIIELADKNLWAWFRTDMGFQYESFSVDCGNTWTPPQPSLFTSPDSPMSAKKIWSTENILAVFNPIPSQFGIAGRRNPFTAVTGTAMAKGWRRYKFIENPLDKEKGYCYTAIHETCGLNGNVMLAYNECIYKKDRFSIGNLIIRKI